MQCGQLLSKLGGDQCRWPFRSSVPPAPLSPFTLSQKPLFQGLQCSRERDIESKFMERCLEPELVHPSRDQSYLGKTRLHGRWGPGEGGLPSLFCIPVQARLHWGTPGGSALNYSIQL